MRNGDRISLLGQPSLWEWVLSTGDVDDLICRDNVGEWIEQIRRIHTVVERRIVGEMTAQLLVEDDAAWALWENNVRCLSTVARLYRPRARVGACVAGGMTGRPFRCSESADELRDMPEEAAVNQFHWHIRRCRPAPIALPSGRLVMPNSFDIRKAETIRPVRGEWKELGLDPDDLDGVRIVRDWWILVFATAAIPERPLCLKCECCIPDTKVGRRSRRDVCRKCVNVAYYHKSVNLGGEELREKWRMRKAAQRKKTKKKRLSHASAADVRKGPSCITKQHSTCQIENSRDLERMADYLW